MCRSAIVHFYFWFFLLFQIGGATWQYDSVWHGFFYLSEEILRLISRLSIPGILRLVVVIYVLFNAVQWLLGFAKTWTVGGMLVKYRGAWVRVGCFGWRVVISDQGGE